jgi:hypothetical protein
VPGMGHSDAWWRQYEALRRAGHSKESAARITNASRKEKKRGRTAGDKGKPGD